MGLNMGHSLLNLDVSKHFVNSGVLEFVILLVGEAGVSAPQGVEGNQGSTKDKGGKKWVSSHGSLSISSTVGDGEKD